MWSEYSPYKTACYIQNNFHKFMPFGQTWIETYEKIWSKLDIRFPDLIDTKCYQIIRKLEDDYDARTGPRNAER